MCIQPTRSTQPCIPPGSLNRVPASAGIRTGMSPLPGELMSCGSKGIPGVWKARTGKKGVETMTTELD